MSIPANLVYFAHGKESGPWGTKIQSLAKIARKKKFQVESPDYSFTQNADERVKYLLELRPKAIKCLVLVGSSMGGYVSAAASSILKPKGLFLLAPAFFIKGYKKQSPKPQAKHTAIVHGWHDDVVPLKNSIRYAGQYSCQLHILDSDHRLTSALPVIEKLFEIFLEELKR